MNPSVRFGNFEFDPERGELRRYGLRIRAPGQSLKILAALVERPGEIVTRERIQDLLWPHGTVVGFEQSINAAVTRLREALGDSASKAHYIERVPSHGYRFIAPVEALPRAERDAVQEDRPGAMLLHYRLVEKAGAGSMGEVWKAEDTKLGRTVALKFVPEPLACDAGALEAIRTEARHAAAVNHPNICTIYGLEEHGQRVFLVMEYIDGAPLSTALAGGPLPAERIAEIGIQAAEALAAAHSGGVIHRDVKLANLLLTADGRVKLTDFGIAAAAHGRGSPPDGGGGHTPTGTLGYMSPEQARSEPADARSDLFSLGVVLYELATGRLPFRGDTPKAAVEALLIQDPAPPRILNRALPRRLERFILRALEKDAAARWQSASEAAAALRRIAQAGVSRVRWRVGLVAALAVAFTAFGGWVWKRPAAALAERDLIVIADFENKTGDPGFDGALRQALLLQMGRSRYLDILSEERVRSVLGLMGRASDRRLPRAAARDVCRRAGGKAVLCGSVGMLGTRYFVGLEVIGCAGEQTLAHEYQEAESREQVLVALSRAVLKLRGRLGESLASVRKLSGLPAATTPSLEALGAYDVALREKAAGNDAEPLLRRAIQLDPDFATAYFTLARVYSARGQDAEAEEAISRAFALRERCSQREKLAIEGLYHQIGSGDARQAIAVTKLAAQLYPDDTSTWRWSVLAHASLGEYDEAMDVARRQIEVAPEDGMSHFDVAAVLTALGKTAEAGAVMDRAEARGSGSELFRYLRCVLAALADDAAAIEREAESARGKPFEYRVRSMEIQSAISHGQLAKARAIARDSEEREIHGAHALLAAVALGEAAYGLKREASARAKEAMRLDRGRRTAATCAFSLALANEPAAARAILAELLRRYPNDTLLNAVWVPAVRGAIALGNNDAGGAVAAAEAPSSIAQYAWPPYVRGLAYLRLGLGSKAAAEFRSVVERKHNLFATAFSYGAAMAYPAAQLGLARALAMAGQAETSRRTYDEFLAGWKGSDPGIPILAQARAERTGLARAVPDRRPYGAARVRR